MSATAGHADSSGAGRENPAVRLGFQSGQVVQELGYDSDCDDDLRAAIEEVIGGGLVDSEYDDVVDVVLLWFREDDGDLVDALVDALASLADGGHIWLFTPKAGRDGHIEPSEIGEAAPTAGLAHTSSISAGKEWAGTRLVSPKVARSGRR